MKTEHEKYVEIIRPLLKPKRFEHSLNVAQQAVLLAKRHGEDEDKRNVAGILHEHLQKYEPAGAVAMDAKVCYNLGR